MMILTIKKHIRRSIKRQLPIMTMANRDVTPLLQIIIRLTLLVIRLMRRVSSDGSDGTENEKHDVVCEVRLQNNIHNQIQICT